MKALTPQRKRVRQLVSTVQQEVHHHTPGCCKKKKILVSSEQQLEDDVHVNKGLEKMRRLLRTPQKAVKKVLVETDVQDAEDVPQVAGVNKNRLIINVKEENVKEKVKMLEQKRREQRKLAATKNVTAIKRLYEISMKRAVKKCSSCDAEKRGCRRIDFMTVRHVRTMLYGPGQNAKSRSKTIMNWLKEIDDSCQEVRCKKSLDKSDRVRNYFVHDFSFEKDPENAVKNSLLSKLPCGSTGYLECDHSKEMERIPRYKGAWRHR
jgi:cysteinyl-tRNA synthetase